MASVTWIVSSCVLILAVSALRALFGKRVRLEARYILWGLVLLRLLLPFEIGQSAWSVASVVQRAEWTRLSESFTTLPELEITADAGDGTDITEARDDPDGFSGETPAPPAGTAASPAQWRDVLCRAWYAGIALAAALFLASNLRFYLRLRKRRAALDIGCKLKVYSVENLSSSCLFLRSIYVSAETAEDSTKLRHVLAHETAHYRHGDGVWALLRCVALALHWYNPLVWWAAALSRRDSELFADEGALKSLGEGEREEYGVTLIRLSAKKSAAASPLRAATTMSGGKRALKERITMIARKPRAALWAVVVVGIAAALAVGATLAGAAEPDADGPDNAEDVQPDAPGKTEDLQRLVFADAAEAPRGFSMPIDLDHDGVQETVEVREISFEGSPAGATVSVPGTELSFELSVPHAGWGSVFKYVSPGDGRDYLLYYNPNFSTGIGTYWYELYDLTGLVRSGAVEFAVGPMGALDLDGERMEAFAEEINALLEHSTLLASTDGGEIRLGPASAEPYYETYALPLSIFPYEGQEEAADLTLAERIEYYEKALWADFMTGTLPLFTEDVPQFLWYLSAHDLDWRALWELDSGATLELIGAVRGYVAANELDDAEFETLLRRTDGLDGAYAEAYNEVLEALWRRDAPRYLRLWSKLPEEAQNRTIPYHVSEATGFAGIEAARTRMIEYSTLGVTEAPA